MKIPVILPFIFFVFVIAFSCKKKDERLPLITTLNVSEVGANFARCGAVVYYEGDAPITQKGLCWSSSPEPTTANKKTEEGGGENSFSSALTFLEPLTNYYVRAYAVNEFGTYYGEVMSFTTTQGSDITTLKASKVTPTSVVSGGSFVVLPNQSPITESGVCWSTNLNPTLQDNKVSGSLTSGQFTCTLSNLNPNTLYYVRAYLSNSVSTQYGNVVQIKTFFGTMKDIDGLTYNTVKIGTQEWMAENLRVSTYRDLTPIPYVADNTSWNETPTNGACCYYQNNMNNWYTYGYLYSWYAVSNARQIAPLGWHVPSLNEWNTLISNLGGIYSAGAALKTSEGNYWTGEPSVYSTNTSGFSALPAGMRNSAAGYYNLGTQAYFWTSTKTTGQNPYVVYLQNGSPYANNSTNPLESGFSVRLVKD